MVKLFTFDATIIDISSHGAKTIRSEIKTEEVVFFNVGGVTEKALLLLLPNEGFKKFGHHFRFIVPELVQIVTNLEPNIIA